MRNEGFHGVLGQFGTKLNACAVKLCAVTLLTILSISAPNSDAAQAATLDATPIKQRHLDASRGRAKQRPRGEHDQALVNGWPLYRSDRGQRAFNDAMATLQATDGPSPGPAAFKGCKDLHCKLVLPRIGVDGWIPAGRIWVSPNEYVVFAHSPRKRRGRTYRRRPLRSMKYFIYHEFQNSTRNTDPYDTISSHSGRVFVPFYMSKQGKDVLGRRFVIITQIAPYDVRSIHASNKGSAGPGIEVAKNSSGRLERLQALGGVLIGVIIKAKAPRLRVVNHRGSEGRPMLRAYQRRLKAIRSERGGPAVRLPFVPATKERVALVTARLGDMIVRPGVSPSVRVAARKAKAQRRRVARARVKPKADKPRRKRQLASAAPARHSARPTAQAAQRAVPASYAATAAKAEITMSPLARYLTANLATMKRHPGFAAFIPDRVASIGEVSPMEGVVYLLDVDRHILGHVEAQKAGGRALEGKYVFVSADNAAPAEQPFALDLSKPVSMQFASLSGASARPQQWTLTQPPKLARPPQRVSQ